RFEDRSRVIGREQDGAVTIPRAAEWIRRNRQRADQAVVEIESQEPTVRKEPDRSAVGRPERKPAVFGPGQSLRRNRTERSQPQWERTLGRRQKTKRGTVG